MTEKDTSKKTAAKRKVATAKKAAPKAASKAKGPAKKTKETTKKTGIAVPAKDIGIDVKPPEMGCDDKYCPFHGKLSVRGQIIKGKIMSNKMAKGVVIKREYETKNKKYERYEKISQRYPAHCPPCIDSTVGRQVKIMECRPLAKSITYVVIETKE